MTDAIASVEPAAPAVPVTPPAVMAAPEPVAPARPEGLPDSYWDDAAGVKPEAFSRLAELEAAEETRRAGVPESPDKYELKVSGVDGESVDFKPNALSQAVLPVLHELGIGQEGVSKLLGAYAALETAGDDEIASEQAEATKLLGPDQKLVAQRTASIHGYLSSAIGAESAEDIRSAINHAFNQPGGAPLVAKALLALEKVASKVTGAAISAAPPASSHDPFEGLHGAELLTAARARKAG